VNNHEVSIGHIVPGSYFQRPLEPFDQLNSPSRPRLDVSAVLDVVRRQILSRRRSPLVKQGVDASSTKRLFFSCVV